MGDILGLGVTHYPPLSMPDADMAGILKFFLEDDSIPSEERDPANWTPEMQAEWSDDAGETAAKEHRSRLLFGFDRCREVLDAFRPDAVVMWGDDQYENFKEDLIPPYAVLALPDRTIRPWATADTSSAMKDRINVWDEPRDWQLTVHGRPDIAKHLVSALIEEGFDIPYAYKMLHHDGLPHAFINAILYLDHHRRGFEHPVIPFPINCYGRQVVSYQGFISRFNDRRELDPPSPRPDRLMALGAATARVMRESPWRIALVASSSWSHAFLCDKTFRLRPDTPSDKRLYELMCAGDWDAWRHSTTLALEDAGQQELLNWFPLVGAVEELGLGLRWSQFVETQIFNSNKVFAIFAD